MNYGELKGHIEKASRGEDGSFAPLYLITGEDHYLVSKAASLFSGIIGDGSRDFNFTKISADHGLQAFTDALNTFPFFEDHKIVIVPDLTDRPNEAEKAALESYLENPNPSSIGVAICSDDAAAALNKLKGAAAVDCSKIDDRTLEDEMDCILSKPPARTMSRDAIEELKRRTLSGMSRIAAELEKLKAYCESEITLDDVREIVTADTDYQIFELSNAVSEKKADKALMVLDNFLKTGVKPLTVLNLLYGQYRKMLHAELHKGDGEAELARLLGVNPKALYHVRRVSKNYTQIRLKNAADYLHALSCDVVSGRRQDISALHEAVLTLLVI